MSETGKFLQRAALAGAVAIPLGASGAVVTRSDGDEPVRCKGCSGASGFAPDVEGELGARWCRACADLMIDVHPAAAGAVAAVWLKCDGCATLYAADALTDGPLETKWCGACLAKAGEHWDQVAEDDGEP